MKTIKIKRKREHLIHAELYPFAVESAQYVGVGQVYECPGPHSPRCGCAEDDIYAIYYVGSSYPKKRVDIKLTHEECEELLCNQLNSN